MTQNESKWAVHYLGCASVWQSIVTSVPLGAPTSWLGTIKTEYLYYIDMYTYKVKKKKISLGKKSDIVKKILAPKSVP